jgi:hypothetical protein
LLAAPSRVKYFSNSAAVRLPATIAGHVLGVIGLSNTVRLHPAIARPGPAQPLGATTRSSSGNSSDCATFSGSEPAPGWFQIGGTSLSSPLLAAIFADRAGYQGQRTGAANPLLCSLFNSDPSRYFNDITGIGHLQRAATNNGLFPSTPGYDMATGIGTPKMAALISGS